MNFNPRTHEGCDEVWHDRMEQIEVISIHAPTRGATRVVVQSHEGASDFNPRTHEGCDHQSIGASTRGC